MESPFSSPSPPEHFTRRWDRFHPRFHVNSFLLPPSPPIELLETGFRPSGALLPRLQSRLAQMRPQRSAVYHSTPISDGDDVEPIEISSPPSSEAVITDNEDVEEVPAYVPSLRMHSNHHRRVTPRVVEEMPSQKKVAAQELRQMETLIAQLRILQQRRAAERASGSTEASAKPNDAHYEECIICYEPLTAPECSVTKCGHVFHTHCILACTSGRYRSELECPICRQPAHVPELVQIHNGLPSKSAISPSEGGKSTPCKLESQQSEVVVISDGEDSPVCVASTRPIHRPSNNSDLDAALMNTLHNINNGLQKSIDKFSKAESKLSKDFAEKERKREMEYRTEAVTLRKETSKLSLFKRDLEKRETSIRSDREALDNERNKLAQDKSKCEDERKQLDQLKRELEEERRKAIDAQKEAYALRHSLQKREQRLEQLGKSRKRAREETSTNSKSNSLDQSKDNDQNFLVTALCQLSGIPSHIEGTRSVDSGGNEMERDVTEQGDHTPAQKKVKIIKGCDSTASAPANHTSLPSSAQATESLPVLGSDLPLQVNTSPPHRVTRARGTGKTMLRGQGLSLFTASRAKVQQPNGPIGKTMLSSSRLNKR